MNKTVLIPTDFSVGSLNVLKLFLNNYTSKNTRYNVVLLHGYHLSDSITELLFLPKGKIVQSLTSEEFNDALNVIKNKFSDVICSVKTDLFTGFTQSAFANYVEGSNIDLISISSNLKFKRPNKNSFDIIPFAKKLKIEIVDVEWNTAVEFHEEKNISAVFAMNTVSFKK